MKQKETLIQISTYLPYNEVDKNFKIQILELVQSYPDFYDRNLKIGHLTGSAWIVNAQKNKALLVHHSKLDKWLQPGGHTESSDKTIFETSLREAREETGLQNLKLIQENIFDLDVHSISARGEMPEHLHFDVRYLFEADDDEILKLSEESKDLRWFGFDEIKSMTDSPSVLRMVEKVLK